MLNQPRFILTGCVLLSVCLSAVAQLPMPDNVCIGAAKHYNVDPNSVPGSTYTWKINGVIQVCSATNGIDITWDTTGTFVVEVQEICAEGCTGPLRSGLVYVNPVPVPFIGSMNTPCYGSTDTYYTDSGQSNYFWNVSAGTIIGGQGTSVIDVTWTGYGAQTVGVTYCNPSGCNAAFPAIYNLFVNPFPDPASSISGLHNVCAGAVGVTYSTTPLTNATFYQWTLPANAVISSGNGTTSIIVNFGEAAFSGNITVAGVNNCGSGAVSPEFIITTGAIPEAPFVTSSGPVLTSSALSGNQWYYNGILIQGATAQVYTVTNYPGYYWCLVTVGGCSSSISNKVWVEAVGKTDLPVSASFTIYPVPNNGEFTASIHSPVDGLYAIRVYNQVGVNMFELRDIHLIGGNAEIRIDLRPIANGIYSVIFLNSEHAVVKRILIHK